MKWVVDMQLDIILKKSVVVECETSQMATIYVEGLAEHMTGVIGVEETDWDDQDSEYNQIEIDIPVRLLDRRTAERRSDDVSLSETRCDNCDAMNVSTIGYGDARVCSACLRILPPLV